MPLTGAAADVAKSMKKQHGKDWEKVFYSTANKQGRKPETWKKKACEKLAALLDRIPGGEGADLRDSEVPRDQLTKGVQMEREEHGGTPGIAKDIAKDHLAEDKRYYDHLAKMEALGSRINKIAALVPQKAVGPAGVPGPTRFVDSATGAMPTLATGQQQPGAAPAAPKPGLPKLPSPPGSAPMPKVAGAAEIRAKMARSAVKHKLKGSTCA